MSYRTKGWLTATGEVSVARDSVQPLWCGLTVPRDAKSGTYTGSVTVSTVDPASLTMTKTASNATLMRGGSGSYTLAVVNIGGVATNGTVTVTDTLGRVTTGQTSFKMP